jgi:hypothetical protein
VQSAGRRYVGELARGLGDPAPGCLGLLSIPLEHQGGGAPAVVFRYHETAAFARPKAALIGLPKNAAVF